MWSREHVSAACFWRLLPMLIKKKYTFPDLKEMPLDEAPSLDMPHFIVDK